MSAPVTLIAVIGPTAVGKTALAIRLAQRFGGEIVNADSRQVYIGMDIGTAKPTADELRSALHHLIDIRKPDTPLSLGEYLPLARDCVADIAGRGKLPILCGGTGQYVWAMLEGWDVPSIPPDADFRAGLEQRAAADGTRALWNELNAVDSQRAVAIGPHNTRRIIRALEILHSTGEQVSAARRSAEPPFRAFIIGLTAERASLYRRIDERFDMMMSQGLLDEARRLAGAGYELGRGPLSGVGYTQLGQYLAGEISLDEAVARSKSRTHHLVRRQYTWFKPSDPRIAWLDATRELPIAEAARRLVRFLAA
ncbi:MAG: tRNA (adenosine(37)-N6)-dimethylallyltransferase MiaA [Dehalococcoidia bacterium]|nr:tRNA (adenosine(37)-N6)-dimethylallyltransferase MiaA [Dehalococcoidia bacterium]